MTAGRKKKPKHLKLVTGTFRKHREKNSIAPDLSLPSAPEYFTELQKQIFGRLVDELNKLNLASRSWSEVITQCAIRIAGYQKHQEFLNLNDYTYETTNTMGDKVPKARPEVAMRNEDLRHAQSLLAELGLSPTAIGKVTPMQPKDENPFSTF